MKNFVQNGDSIPYTNSTGAIIPAGAVVLAGGLIGIAVDDIAISGSNAIKLSGVFTLAKNTGFAVTVGQKLYWNAAGSFVTATNTDTFIGNATTAQVLADIVVNIKLAPYSA